MTIIIMLKLYCMPNYPVSNQTLLAVMLKCAELTTIPFDVQHSHVLDSRFALTNC